MNQKEQVQTIKQSLMRLPRFRSRCALCHSKKHKSGFTFHHKRYLPGELTYSNFPNPLAYYQYLEPLVRADPNRFILLCSDHHQALERSLRYSDKTWSRLNRLRSETIRSRQEQPFMVGAIWKNAHGAAKTWRQHTTAISGAPAGRASIGAQSEPRLWRVHGVQERQMFICEKEKTY